MFLVLNKEKKEFMFRFVYDLQFRSGNQRVQNTTAEDNSMNTEDFADRHFNFGIHVDS